MRRALCVHAGPLHPGQDRGGRKRPCALGLFGGTVERLRECETCEEWKPRDAQAGASSAPTASPCGCKGAKGSKPCKCKSVVVPQPPALALSPKSKLALVTIVVGDEARACFAVTEPFMRAYARRVGADFAILDWPGNPAWPMSAKFGIARVLDHYERIAYVDADVLLRPGCVNLFELCGPEEFGACDELPYHRARPQFGREKEYHAFRRQMGFAERESTPWMLNAGVMVVPRSHRALLLPPAGEMPTAHCSEQDHTNARLLDSGLPYRLLDRRGNWQHWTDYGYKDAPADAILHYSGAQKMRPTRAEQMREVARRQPCVFGVGIEKSGTHTLAAMLGLPHQPTERDAIRAIFGEHPTEDVIRRKLGGDVSNLNVHFLAELLAEYPAAKFVLTVREPLSWLRSSINHRDTQASADHWKRIDKLRKGAGELPDLLRYWEWHNRRVLDTIPAERRLILRTDGLSHGAHILGRFAGIAAEPAHEFAGHYPGDPLAGHDPAELARLAAELCPTWAAVEGAHPWYCDARHVELIRAELLTGKYRRVLEIGCAHGWSTRAFLEAAKAGAVEEVHLCDPRFTPELRAVFEAADLGERVKLHECSSVELLARDSAWGFVFVDGDHSAKTCRAEAEALIAARVPTVFAHDTAAERSGYPHCPGPAILAARFRAEAGYRCEEDSAARPGEWTDRGLFMARRSEQLGE